MGFFRTPSSSNSRNLPRKTLQDGVVPEGIKGDFIAVTAGNGCSRAALGASLPEGAPQGDPRQDDGYRAVFGGKGKKGVGVANAETVAMEQGKEGEELDVQQAFASRGKMTKKEQQRLNRNLRKKKRKLKRQVKGKTSGGALIGERNSGGDGSSATEVKDATLLVEEEPKPISSPCSGKGYSPYVRNSRAGGTILQVAPEAAAPCAKANSTACAKLFHRPREILGMIAISLNGG